MDFNDLTKEMTDPIKVLFIASEADPLIKVGGLGDVAGSLPAAIHYLNRKKMDNVQVDIRLAIPFYEQIKSRLTNVSQVGEFTIPSKDGPVTGELYATTLAGLTVYLVSGKPVTNTPEVYSRDFAADAEKFIFFSLACLEIPRVVDWKIDILHAHDWHTATAIHTLPLRKKTLPQLENTRSILSLHNLPFMGTGAEAALSKYKVPPSKNKQLPDWGQHLPLPMGLATADKIVAVSPTYASEILTPEYGCDLQDFLLTRKEHITGIINGIDNDYWNPATDTSLARNYSSGSMSGKKHNKLALQREFGLEENPEIPLMVMITRMDRQKGVDILIKGLKSITDLSWQVILLGTGDPLLEKACLDFQRAYPHKVKTSIKFDTQLSRRMYGGADFFLMPSRYEPCGLAQMIAMRYGCIPIARATGGLVDTIKDHTQSTTGSGFLFTLAKAGDFSAAVVRGLGVYADKKVWREIQSHAMSLDYSWENSAEKYYQLYRSMS